MSPIYAHQIFSDSYLQFLNGSHFGIFLWFATLPIWTVIETSYHIYLTIFFTYIHKRNNATVFSEIYEHFSKFHILLTSLRHHVLWHMHALLWLSFALLANYVPKCQMSSGLFGPIFQWCIQRAAFKFVLPTYSSKNPMFDLTDRR